MLEFDLILCISAFVVGIVILINKYNLKLYLSFLKNINKARVEISYCPLCSHAYCCVSKLISRQFERGQYRIKFINGFIDVLFTNVIPQDKNYYKIKKNCKYFPTIRNINKGNGHEDT